MDPVQDKDQDRILDPDVQTMVQDSCEKRRHPALLRKGALAAAIEQGDLVTLQELSDFPEAFSRRDEQGWFPLHRAAVQPRLPVLETVLHASVRLSLEEKTLQGETLLTMAVRAGLLDNVKMLLKHGASPLTVNARNQSPLLLAVRSGSPPLVSWLIGGGAPVEQVCLRKWTAVHEASRGGCVAVMEVLLQNGGQVMQTDQHGVTPLGIAAEYGRPEVMELLIRHGADVNAQAPNGDSVLYDAAGSGNPDCVNTLLRHGANPNVHNLSGQLPVHRAAYEGHFLPLRILIPLTTRRALRLSGQNPVHSAADGGHAHCLELLLREGFDVNAPLAQHVSENYGDMRRSPLYFAVANGDAACTAMLLAAGADPDLDPLRCLLVAVRSGRHDLVELLLAAGADVNCYFRTASNTAFPTALQYCLKDPAMMRLLLNNGYDASRCFSCYHDDEEEEEEEEQNRPVTFCRLVGVSWLEHLVGPVVLVLLDYVGPVSLCWKLVKILKNRTEWPDIHRTTSNPRSLAHLSRLEVRKHLSCGALASVHLPNRLKSFLLFTDT